METLREFIDVEGLLTTAVAFLPRLVVAIVIFVAFVFLFRIVRIPLHAALRKADLQEKLVDLLIDKLLRYLVLLIGLVMAADQLGVNVGAALAGMGVAGIALGFAAQDSVANFISGILIFWDKPFIVGDWIKTESEYGQVKNITLRTTRIRTPRNTYIVIPNKRIIDELLENFSKHGALRVDVPIGIAYKEDVAAARAALLDAVSGLDLQFEQEKEADVVVDELGDSSVNLNVRVWIRDAANQPSTTAAVLEAGKNALDAAGIQIPFPHLQLMLDNVEPPVWDQLQRVVGGRS